MFIFSKIFRKKLFFYFVMFIFLLIVFEIIFNIAGYFYFYVYSNLNNPKIEKDSFRILFLGESTTQGAGIGVENAYPAQIEKILQQKYPDKNIRCYNKGIGGIETLAILRNLNGLLKCKPHLTVLMVGWNDRGDWKDDSVIGNTFRLKSLYSKFKFYNLIVSIRDVFRLILGGDNRGLTNIHEIIYGYRLNALNSVPQIVFNLNAITEIVQSYSSEIWFVGYLQPDAREKVNPVLQKVAGENNVTYTGDYPEVDFVINRSLFSEDGWHPSKEGHAIIAEKIAERIIQEGIVDRGANNN